MTTKTILKRAVFIISVLLVLSTFVFRYVPAILAGLLGGEVVLLIVAILVLFVYYFIKIVKTIK